MLIVQMNKAGNVSVFHWSIQRNKDWRKTNIQFNYREGEKQRTILERQFMNAKQRLPRPENETLQPSSHEYRFPVKTNELNFIFDFAFLQPKLSL